MIDDTDSTVGTDVVCLIVDCNPVPEIPYSNTTVTYYDRYALMEIECKAGSQFYPKHLLHTGPGIIECHAGSRRKWLNKHLWECRRE